VFASHTEDRKHLLLFAGLGIISFLPFLWSAPLFDWDEINFAESAREMIASGNYFQVQINYKMFWEKPPLFFWLQVVSMKIFGINEFAARFPNAVTGIFTLVILYVYGSRLKNKIFGSILAFLYISSILPHLYFKSGIIDPVFNLFIFIGIIDLIEAEYKYYSGEKNNVIRTLNLKAGLWIGLATLTKGPVALLIVGLTYLIFQIGNKFRNWYWLNVLIFMAAWLIPVLAWFGLETVFYGTEFISLFIKYQIELFTQPVAGHDQPFYYHFVVFLVGCLPLSAFFIRGMIQLPLALNERITARFMIVWWWVILILFSISETKIVHYSSMAYLPGVVLAGFGFYKLMERNRSPKWETTVLLILGSIAFGIGSGVAVWLFSHPDSLVPLMNDPFAVENLKAITSWSGYEYLIGLGYFILLIVALVFLLRKKYFEYLYVSAGSTVLFLSLINALVVPEISKITQGAPVDFYKNISGENCYFLTANYKSYAPYFYGQLKPINNPQAHDENYLIDGLIDKPVYMSVKVTQRDSAFYQRYKNFKFIKESAGFAFYKREIVQTK